MFYLTRFLVELIAPLNFCILLLFLALLLHLTHRVRAGSFVLFIAICVLLASGYGVGIKDHVRLQENKHLPLTDNDLKEISERNVKYIVVLGSGHVSDVRLPVNSQIGGASLYRLIEGIRIHSKIKGSVLIICGGVGYDPVPNALVVRDVAEILGVSEEYILLVDSPRNTQQEAEGVKPIVGDSDFVLVSSALHMPRAFEIFQNLGMKPIPSTTDYIMKEHLVEPVAGLLPSVTNLELTRRITYEWIGEQWMKLEAITKNYL